MVKNFVLTPPDYDRDIRHYEFDIHGLGMPYSPGDCLGEWSENDTVKTCVNFLLCVQRCKNMFIALCFFCFKTFLCFFCFGGHYC